MEEEREFTISNRLGLHARAAAEFVKTTGSFGAEVRVVKDGFEANVKSIMGIMMLAAPQGSVIRVIASGSDAAHLLDALDELIARGCGDEC